MAIDRARIIRVLEGSNIYSPEPNSILEFDCGCDNPCRIAVPGKFEDIVKFINIGRWERIR